MARTAKTSHVMNLVGSGTAKRANPAVAEHAQIQRPPAQSEPLAVAPHAPMTSLQELQKLQELEELKEAIAAVESELNTEPPKADTNAGASKEAPDAQASPDPESDLREKPAIKAVVLELINEELESVVKRFKLEPNDNNLWELTRAVLESVRPEFSLSDEDYLKKADRLRSRVISEMTKTAIKIAKRD